jgi:hypothetical protein
MYLFFAGDDRCLLSVVNGTRESFSVFSKYANKQKSVEVRWVSIHASKKIYVANALHLPNKELSTFILVSLTSPSAPPEIT